MAQTSKNGSSLRPPRHDPRDESWKTAPSRETTSDDPDGENQRLDRESKRLENTPGRRSDEEEREAISAGEAEAGGPRGR